MRTGEKRIPWPYRLVCFDCQIAHTPDYTGYRCVKCGGLLEIHFDLTRKKTRLPWNRGSLQVWKYRELIPVNHSRNIVTLNEGGTGLHRCRRLGNKLGLRRLYVKNEGENPTGSFKDRGMTVAISKAIELRKTIVVCASTGNTAASLAAYSARAGLESVVFVPAGKVAGGKMLQVVMHGARIVQVKGDFDKAMKTVEELTMKRKNFYLMNSLNPFRLEGQKTLAFETCDQLKRPPDNLVLPIGNGGNISAIWKGFTEYHELDIIKTRPQMLGVQAVNSAPIVQAVKSRRKTILPVTRPKTIATAIRIGAPVNSSKVLKAIQESHGTAITVTDKEILEHQKMLASLEGIFVEPASAASIAGLKKLKDSRVIDSSDVTVAVTTGHGLKDPSVMHYFSHVPGYTVKITEANWIQKLEDWLL